MSSELKNQANLANAQHSTGPRTEEGKAISSRNATKHGLTASTVLLPAEDPAVYQTLSTGMLRELSPINTTETAMVLELIDVQWRLRRASVFEARILSSDTPDMKALNGMSLCAARLKRQYSATLKEFQQMHEVNSKERHKQLEEAALVYQADRILNRPSTVASCGFDITLEDIDVAIAIEEAVNEAREVVGKWELDGGENDQEDDFEDAA